MGFDMGRLIPYYIQQVVINLLAILIPVLLLVQAFHRKHKTPEIRIFVIMCFSDILLCLFTAFESFVLLFAFEVPPFLHVLGFVSHSLRTILSFVMVLFWLLFTEYTLHQSVDIIKRRYPVALIPFFAGVAITVLSLLGVLIETFPFEFLYVVEFLNQFVPFIWAGYILASYIVLYREKKRKKIPEYIRLTPTVIAIISGYVLDALIQYRLMPLGYAVGLLFMDYFMFRRLSFMDQESGFYNEKYLAVLSKEAEKKKIHDATAIRFKTSGDQKKLIEVLRCWKPEFSKVIHRDDGEILILSEILKKTLAERFIFLVQEQCTKEGLETEASFEYLKL